MVRWLPALMLLMILPGCASEDPEGDGTPTAPSIELRPDRPLAADWLDVLLVTPSFNPDGAALEHQVRWSRDGAAVPETDDLVAVWPELTLAGQLWEVAVRGLDGEVEGPAATASITIQGAAPSISSVALTPWGPTVEDTLTARPRDWEDADGDPAMYRYSWLVNAVEVGTSDTLAPGRFAVDDVVQVLATPFDGLLNGEVTPSLPATIRVADACFGLGFDGVDDSVSFDGFLQNLTEDFTIEAWVAPNGSGDRVIASTATDGGGWSLLVDDAGFLVLDTLGVRATSDTIVPLDSDAHHVAVSRREADTRLTFWIDGEAAGGVEHPPAGENGPLYLGRFGDVTSGWFSGTIDDVRLASLPRYSNVFVPDSYWPADGFTTGLWHFAEGADGQSDDASGGRRTAILDGPNWTETSVACREPAR
jgi:hypothetical protein